MQIFWTLVSVVQIISALAMIGLVLVQHGKGADMGASFGTGSSGSLFGATGSANFLSRSTAVCASIFFACTLALAGFGHRTNADAGGGGSVLDRSLPTAVSTPDAASTPAAASAAMEVPPVAAPTASGAAAIPAQ